MKKSIASLCQKKRIIGEGLSVRSRVNVAQHRHVGRRWHSSGENNRDRDRGDDTATVDCIQTDGGTIEGVWIFMRHGDRAPSRPLSPPHKVPTEADFWRSRLPRPDTLEAFEGFSHYYPPAIHDEGTNNGRFIDASRAPFGFLTHTGVMQTNELGTRLFQRYNNHGYVQSSSSTSSSPSLDSRTASGFLKAWDIKAYSTNYIRTILSAQSMLDGLLGTKCYSSLAERLRRTVNDTVHGQRTLLHDEYFEKELRVPDHDSVAHFLKDYNDHSTTVDSDVLVPVQVRGPGQDTLNAFDRDPTTMADLVSDVIMSPDFQEGDGSAAPLAARLANILPGLARKKKNTTGFNAAPSGINWIEASDHFVCRSAHSVPFARFSDFEHDEQYESSLMAMSHQTTAHLAWRFRQWYKNPVLLAHIAAPALREVCDQLLEATQMDVEDKHPFTIYACHDITILGLLYGISADFLSGDSNAGWRYWPKYASTLIFELIRIQNQDGDDEHIVRVLLDGKPVKSLIKDHISYWEGSCKYTGNAPHQMLYASDFDRVVQNLEKAGGQSSYMTKGGRPKTKIDMSNVTG